MPKAGSALARHRHIDQISMQPLPSFDEPPAVRIGGDARIIWVEGQITERNDADDLAVGCDEIPPIPGVYPRGAGGRAEPLFAGVLCVPLTISPHAEVGGHG